MSSEAERAEKMANRTSHRYNYLPLLPSDPGGVQQELVVPICQAKDTIDSPQLATLKENSSFCESA